MGDELILDPEVEALWGAQPKWLQPVDGRWGIGRVVARTPGEQSAQPRYGVWELSSGKVVFRLSGAVGLAFSPDRTQIAVWRESLGSPMQDDQRRPDWRWTFERRGWPDIDRVLSSLDVTGEENAWYWPGAVHFPTPTNVVLECQSDDGTTRIEIDCSDGGDRRTSPPMPPRPAPRAPKAKPKAKAKKAKPRAAAKTKTKTKTKTKRRAAAKPKAKPKTKKPTKRRRR